MFSNSTQCKHWMFKDDQQVSRLRQEANCRFIERHNDESRSQDSPYEHFLTADEERMIYKHYEFTLRDFCKKFQPPVPRSVIGTSFHYFKRFYLNNSVMDYHPKHMLVTCVYLACKVEEFNVSIAQFVSNLRGDREKATDIILSHELLLMQQLKYHLTVHNPYRPLEGLLIDIKTRCRQFPDPEKLRVLMDDFLDRTLFTDAMLLMAPSQIALTAVLYAANKAQSSYDAYVTDVLFANSSRETLQHIRDTVKRLWLMVKSIEVPQKDKVKAAEQKLEGCRNQENNPDSQVYKRKLQEMLDDEPVDTGAKYARYSEDERVDEDALGGTAPFDSP
ncbi:cyclin-H-like [Ornithodoros turicata]|uniref:Cyclin-H n=1 Tax=Ornithodoros turicata TaxID=34597 RepID=A0A2R5LFQ4_9ACAR